MIKQVLKSGDPALRLKSKPASKVDKKVKSLIKDLKDTLINHRDPEGVGLAAPQIGKNVRVFVMKQGKNIKAVVNPKIVKISATKTKKSGKMLLEGCLSVPHYYGPLKRQNKVVLSYITDEGKRVTEKFEGFEAQIILHEIDHLDGVLFVDKLLEENTPLFKQNSEGEWEEVEL